MALFTTLPAAAGTFSALPVQAYTLISSPSEKVCVPLASVVIRVILPMLVETVIDLGASVPIVFSLSEQLPSIIVIAARAIM